MMQVKYFEDTDTLYFQLNDRKIVETRDLDENTLLELDESGNVVGLTVEHAKKITDVSDFAFHHILSKAA